MLLFLVEILFFYTLLSCLVQIKRCLFIIKGNEVLTIHFMKCMTNAIYKLSCEHLLYTYCLPPLALLQQQQPKENALNKSTHLSLMGGKEIRIMLEENALLTEGDIH